MVEYTQFQYDCLKLKQMNDYFWVEYSRYSIPIIVAIFIYKFFFYIDYRHCKKYSEIPHLLQDKILVPFLIYAPINYLVDSFCLVGSGLIYQNVCRFDMLIHHFVSFTFLPMVILSRYVPYHQFAPAVMHAFVITYPEQQWLNYPYLASMIIFHIGLYRQPYTNFYIYKILKVGVVILYVVFIFIFFHGCDVIPEDFLSNVTKIHPTPGYISPFELLGI